MKLTWQILINVFFSLLVISLLIYSVIFFIYKSLFKKEKRLMEQWNKLSTSINTLNITKLNILANNNLSLKQDINNLLQQFNNVKQELNVIFKNIETIRDLVSKISVSIANKYIKICRNDLWQCKQTLSKIIDKYNVYFQYSDTIANSLDDVVTLFEKSKTFFKNNIVCYTNFISITNHFNKIGTMINNLSKLVTNFDFKATINLWFDLTTNLQQISNLILNLYKFQIVDNYLLNNCNKYKAIIAKSYSSIVSDDLKKVDGMFHCLKQAYYNFTLAYKQLDFAKTNIFMIEAINHLNKISQFVLISVYANNIIKNNLDELASQTNTILANHDQIINSVDAIIKFFYKNVQVVNWLTSIKNNVSDIVTTTEKAKNLVYTEFAKKISSMNSLIQYSAIIYQKKQVIANLIASVNDSLDKVISNIKQLNNLYLCYWQLLSMLNNLVPTGKESYQINNLIKENLDKVNSWLNKIIHNQDINHQDLSLQIVHLIDNFSYLYKKIITYAIFQNYAANLMVYANRYHTSDNQDIFDQTQKLYDQKQFTVCLDKLLDICHKK